MSRRRRNYSRNRGNHDFLVATVCAFFIAVYHIIRAVFIHQENKKQKACTVNGVSLETQRELDEANERRYLQLRFNNDIISIDEYFKEKKRIAAKYGKEH